ncbi:MAG TPA: prolipoprotein diacylglyceryl transferase [Bacilli bacterium]
MFLYDHNSIKPLDPSAISFGNFEVQWYGIFIVTGAIIALLWGLKVAKRLKVDQDFLIDGFVWGLVLGVIGARLWYVIFEWDAFKNDLLSIIGIVRDSNGKIIDWELSGLAIHGAFIAAAIFVIFYCKKKKVSVFKVAELVAPGFLVGQTLGRWGNFFNQEAHGSLVPGATLDAQRAWLENLHLPDFIINQMYITRISDVAPEVGYYHPTFLYESLWNFLGIILIIIFRKFVKKYWVGDALFFYLIWYSTGRFFIEFLRTDPLVAGGIRVAQATSVVLFTIGLVGFILRRKYQVYPVSFMNFNEE